MNDCHLVYSEVVELIDRLHGILMALSAVVEIIIEPRILSRSLATRSFFSQTGDQGVPIFLRGILTIGSTLICDRG